jgi:hypothetical protein
VIGARPIHLAHFANAHDYACDPGFVSFADLKPTAIWTMENNVREGRSFCHGFHTSWGKPSNLIEPSGDARIPQMWALHAHRMMKDWALVSSSPQPPPPPPPPPPPAPAGHVSETAASPPRWFRDQQHVLVDGASSSSAAETSSTGSEAQEQLAEEHTKSKSACELSVAFTNGVEYILPLMSAVFADAYPHCRVSLSRESELDPASTSTDVHVLLYSVLDGSKTGVGFDDGCRKQESDLVQKWAPSGAVRVLISGEPWDISAADRNAVLIDTKLENRLQPTPLLRQQSSPLYLPVLATSFGERNAHTPFDLRRNQSPGFEAKDVAGTKTKFCAYLYFRCADMEAQEVQPEGSQSLRTHREALFDRLSDANMGAVDALGNCRGLRQKPRGSSLQRSADSAEAQAVVSRRFARNWHDEAVALYRDYKFCFAFENSDVEGYISEKIANAMLADCVPIYAGSALVEHVFNPASYIDCSPSKVPLERCVQKIRHVHESSDIYYSMLRAEKMTLRSLERTFSWHPLVNSSHFANSFRSSISERAAAHDTNALLTREGSS